MVIMKIEIVLKDSKWTVNGKQCSELNPQEQKFMDDFFREVKIKSINYENN